MDLNTITVDDFKGFFRRDFPFLPTYNSTTTYNINDKAYYNGLFYESKSDGVVNILPTVSASWNRISENSDNYILDEDITKGFSEAQALINQGLFGTEAQVKQGYLYLTAHFLVNDIRTSMQGVQSTGEQIVNSRSVGSVSESYTIPQIYLDDPILAFYAKTGYGMKYLALVLPLLRGNIGVVDGWTNP